jgi:hypothetical protein
LFYYFDHLEAVHQKIKSCQTTFKILHYIRFDITVFLTVILFIVRVPVLSLAIKVALPSVSKDSNFLTKTFLSPRREAIIAKVLVTVAGSP